MQISFHPIPNFLQRVYPRIGPIRAITEDKSNFKRHTAAKQYRIDVAERKRGPQWRVPLGQMTRHFVILFSFAFFSMHADAHGDRAVALTPGESSRNIQSKAERLQFIP